MLDMFGLQSQLPPSQSQLPPIRSQLPPSQLPSKKTQSSTVSLKETADSLAEDCLNRPCGKNTGEDSSDDEFMAEQPAQPAQNEPEMVEVVWLLEFVYPNMNDCQKAIDKEDCWTKHKTLSTANGTKTGYRCKHVKRRGKQCSAGIYTIHGFDPNSSAVRLYRKNLAHDHGTSENQVTAISDEMKAKIIDMYGRGEKPKGIMYQLQRDPENIVPSMDRLRNVIEMYKLQKYGKSNVTMNDLQKFYDRHSAIPIDEDQAFVAGFQRSNAGDVNNWFRLFATTKRLLLNSINADCIHADGTYKLNIQNYPILTVGTTDKTQRFHLLGMAVVAHERTEDYQFIFDAVQDTIQKITIDKNIAPRVLMADAAAAIHNGYRSAFAHIQNKRVMMCWYHVLFNVNKQKFRNQKNKDEIKKDLNRIHFLNSEEKFDEAMKLFVVKWSVEEPEFVQYFDTNWVQKNKYWFHIEDRIPTTNNANESFHSTLKNHQTHWQKKGLAEFLPRILEIVEERSLEYNITINEEPKEPFAYEVDIPNKLKSKGLELAMSPKQFISKKSDDGTKTTIYCRSNEDAIGDDDVNKFSNIEWNKFKDFNDLVEAAENMRVIEFTPSPSNWKQAKCSCQGYVKKFMCKHIIAIAFRVKVLQQDIDPDDQPLKPNNKRGRPKKASKGLNPN